jgi:hypothetical protein
MHLSPSCLINDLWTDLAIEPLTGKSNDKFDGRKLDWIGTANGIHDPPSWHSADIG